MKVLEKLVDEEYWLIEAFVWWNLIQFYQKLFQDQFL